MGEERSSAVITDVRGNDERLGRNGVRNAVAVPGQPAAMNGKE